MPCPSIGPKWFWTAQIVFVGYKSFWSGTNHFGQVQIRLFWTNFHNLDLCKIIWTRIEQIGAIQNDWYSTKIIWTIQNYFGPIGITQSIFVKLKHHPSKVHSVGSSLRENDARCNFAECSVQI